MSHTKRSRTAYEADLYDETVAHIKFGTPLPPLDPDVRDDGSYVPLHKQEVRDERGRRRLHGAFTGGWSAGYFNTVGSKEGWTPSTFMSSRTTRRKGGPTTASQRPEDYMDDEDLADAAATQNIRTSKPFASLGDSGRDQRQGGGLAGLMHPQGDAMGYKLLRKMGWKDGQGIGPKVRRQARLDVANVARHLTAEETHLFAPEDVEISAFVRKADRRGLGCKLETRLSRLPTSSVAQAHRSASNEDESGDSDDGGDHAANHLASRPKLGFPAYDRKNKQQVQRGGFGVGVLNDTGSDDDDPYEMGPRISYSRVLGGDKLKKKKSTDAIVPANPTLSSRPIFISKIISTPKGQSNGRCHDGRMPLKGFTMGRATDARRTGQAAKLYSPPVIPMAWASNRRYAYPPNPASYVSTADAAKPTHHDPKSRAAVLGESSLPGKSVFDYMSKISRERLALASGKTNLPPAGGEIPLGYGSTELVLQKRLRNLPPLSKQTAIAAMSRGAGAGGPYASDDAKRRRYRLYLQYAAGFGGSPVKPSEMTDDDFVRELQEFYGCAQLFKPMTGFMATRFTTASAETKLPAGVGSESASDTSSRHSFVAVRSLDPAEEAAKTGMYGRMTRLTKDFFPTRLLCKRFNVRVPAHAQTASEVGTAPASQSPLPLSLANADVMDMPVYSEQSMGAISTLTYPGESPRPRSGSFGRADVAGETTRPSDEVFKSIFGDSSDDEK